MNSTYQHHLAVSIIILSLCLSLVGLRAPVRRVQAAEYSFGAVVVVFHIPLFVAQEKGWFQEEGIQLDMKIYATLGDWFESAKNQRKDLTPMLVTSVLDLAAQDVNYTILGGYTQFWSVKLLVRPGIEAKDIQRVGVPSMVAIYPMVMWKYFQQHGLPLNMETLKPMSQEEAAENLQVGRIDAMVSSNEALTQRVIRDTNATIELTAADIPELTHLVFAATKPAMQSISSTELKGFWKAIIRASQYVKNPANLKDIQGIMHSLGLKEAEDDMVFANIVQQIPLYLPEDL